MKILLCLNNDIQSNVALNLLLPALTSHEVQVLLSAQVGGQKSNKPPLLMQLAFLEQDFLTHLFFPWLEAQPPSAGKFLSFKQLSEKYRVSITSISNINDETSLSAIRSFTPDLIVSIRHGKIFKQPLISIPKHGIINLHSGILPNYRGVLATFRALMNGDKTIGTTLHYIPDHGIDTGDIIALSQLKVEPNRSFLWHTIQLYYDGVRLIRDAIHHIENQITVTSIPQSEELSQYYSFPTDQEFNGFAEKGWKLFDMKEYLDFLTQEYCDNTVK